MLKVDKNILKEIYTKRPDESRKYDFGLVLVIGGSEFYTGSSALSAMAAFRTGCDMVHILAPKRAADIIAGFSPNLATLPLKGAWLDKEDLATLISMTTAAKKVSNGKTAVVIGGGLGRSQETQDTIKEYLSQIEVPCVIDADAIYALAEKPEIAKGKNFLVTPHAGEFLVLSGKQIAGLDENKKIDLVQKEAERLGLTILLKGKTDIIVSNKKEVGMSATGSASMTVGGTGDTLAGIAGAIMARGISPFKSGCAASYINGLAGEKATKKWGEALLATDLIKEIASILPKTC